MNAIGRAERFGELAIAVAVAQTTVQKQKREPGRTGDRPAGRDLPDRIAVVVGEAQRDGWSTQCRV